METLHHQKKEEYKGTSESFDEEMKLHPTQHSQIYRQWYN